MDIEKLTFEKLTQEDALVRPLGSVTDWYNAKDRAILLKAGVVVSLFKRLSDVFNDNKIARTLTNKSFRDLETRVYAFEKLLGFYHSAEVFKRSRIDVSAMINQLGKTGRVIQRDLEVCTALVRATVRVEKSHTPYQQLVIFETEELRQRLLRIETYIAGVNFSNLEKERQDLLNAQLSAMRSYLSILDQRIAMFVPAVVDVRPIEPPPDDKPKKS